MTSLLQKFKSSQSNNLLRALEGWVVGTFLGVAALLAIGTNLIFLSHADRALPNIYIEDQLIGGLNQAEISQVLKENFVIQDQLVIRPDQAEATSAITAQELGLEYNFKPALETALAYGKSGSWLERTKILLHLTRRPLVIELKPDIDHSALGDFINKVAQEINQDHQDPFATLGQSGRADTLKVDPGTIGRELDQEQAKHAFINQILQQARTTSNQARLYPSLFINLAEAIRTTGYSLSEIQTDQAKDRAEKFVGQNLKLSHELANFQLSDQDLVKLLAFPEGINQEQLDQHFETWAEKIDRPPVEPVFEYDPATLKVTKFTPPRDGLELQKEELTKQISQLLDQPIEADGELSLDLPTAITPPNLSLAETNDLGIIEKIGYGDSLYRGSIPNRAYNVALSAGRTSLIIVPPGKEFSFNQTLGEVSTSTGYRQAYVIRSGRTELGDGGGVCQVSTTVFRAALDAGLKITRRLQHSYRVGYYEQNSKPGLDATVYSGGVDLRFVNDTDEHILIYNEVNSSNMSMKTEIYGTSDGRQTEIIEHTVWDPRPAPPAEYYPDPSLPAGTTRQIDWAVGGVKTRVINQIRDADGEVIREDEYYSNYRPWAAKYLQGV